jgi:dsDNA-specific endonuclease/ATPase MutS2
MNAKSINRDIKKVVSAVKDARAKLEHLMKTQDWVDEARKYAERQRKEVRKIITSDTGKIRNLVENQRKELEKFQKQIPGEVKRVQNFVKSQQKELQKLVKNLRKSGAKGAKKSKSGGTKRKKAVSADASS